MLVVAALPIRVTPLVPANDLSAAPILGRLIAAEPAKWLTSNPSNDFPVVPPIIPLKVSVPDPLLTVRLSVSVPSARIVLPKVIAPSLASSSVPAPSAATLSVSTVISPLITTAPVKLTKAASPPALSSLAAVIFPV